MNNCKISPSLLSGFRNYLIQEEKAPATIEKYVRDIAAFCSFVGEREITKELLIEYKNSLISQYKPSSVNSFIAALNHFFKWCGWDLHLKALKIQRKVFCDEKRELTRKEYFRLLGEAKARHDRRLYLLMQTLGSTGIRISELRYITVQAAKRGRADVRCKGKNRTILIPATLCKLLLAYAAGRKIKSGPIFLTKTGQLMNRSNIWKALRSLCEAAGVLASKVFPHNFRHLFATTFYRAGKDIAKLADILGHSSINTTRIYIATSGQEHAHLLNNLGLIRPDTT